MITRTFLSKCNTIIKGSRANMGLNPVCALNYGESVSRILIYFDTDKIKKLYEDETFAIEGSVTHTLKMKNCGSIDPKKYSEFVPGLNLSSCTKRATSFDVIFFKIPEKWDCGVGFDEASDYWLRGNASLSTDGSNWDYAYNGKRWREYDGEGAQPGIYSSDELEQEFQKYGNGEESIILGYQHFDYGNEDIKLDLTDYIKSIIEDEEENNGIGIAFSPLLEDADSELTNYVGFYTNTTNTFFQPCIETRYNEQILDDRYSFCLDKPNKLYFYAFLEDSPCALDKLPTCTVNGVKMPVYCQTKGVYYAEVKLTDKLLVDTIQYDVWSDIVLKGEKQEDEEFEFVVLPKKAYVEFKELLPHNKKQIYPVAYGINDGEVVRQGETREIDIVFKVPFTKTDFRLVRNAKYKLYVKDGNKFIDLFDWDVINLSKNLNFITIDTDSLLPNEYHMDIEAEIGREKLVFKDVLRFRILNNETDERR